MEIRIGVDLGGTKIEAIALGNDHTELVRRRVDTPRDDYRGTLGAIVELVSHLEEELGRQGSVGIGIPGIVSPASGLVKNANSTWLIGKPLDRDLEEALGRPVRLENDANCLALSEATDGAAAGVGVVFAVILGTGVGGGIVVDGRVITGAHAIAGEWGHNPLPWPTDDERPGPECYCGRHGCIETFLSGPGLARDYRSGGGEPLEAPAIVERAASGDEAAVAAMERYERRLARALATVINVLDPEVIVMGGGLSKVDRLYETVPDLWGPHVFSDEVQTRLVAACHGDSSGVRGAAWLWPE